MPVPPNPKSPLRESQWREAVDLATSEASLAASPAREADFRADWAIDWAFFHSDQVEDEDGDEDEDEDEEGADLAPGSGEATALAGGLTGCDVLFLSSCHRPRTREKTSEKGGTLPSSSTSSSSCGVRMLRFLR